MNRKRQSTRGWTLIEIMAAASILVMALTAAISGWMFVLRGERLNSVQNELDIDVRKAMERLRVELRASSMDKIFFYPEGPGPYEAISFPLSIPDATGCWPMDTNTGKIIWLETRCYHEWNGQICIPKAPDELRMTLFHPRDNGLSAAQRQAQLDSVVENGNGASTYNSANATTRPIFANLFDWKIWGKGAQFDAYSSTVNRDSDVNLGSVVLTPGSHAFKFSLVGKNALSSGYKVGLDRVVVSPCGLPREAEAQLPATGESGGTADDNYMAAGAWSGNYDLLFPGTAEGHTFTLNMENDRWEESNFQGTGALCEDTVVEFDHSLVPKDFVVRIPTGGYWNAEEQTSDLDGALTVGIPMRDTAVRVLVRGNAAPDGGAIPHSGPLHCMTLCAGQGNLVIERIWIAQAKDATNGFSLDFTGTPVELTAWNPSSIILAGTSNRVEIAAGQSFDIDKSLSYVVTFLVSDDGAQGDVKYWRDYSTNCWASAIIPESVDADEDDCTDPTWSDRAEVIYTNRLIAVTRLHTLAPTNGTFTSQVVDTKLTSPVYTAIDWHAIKPEGTTLGIKVRTGSDELMTDAPAWSGLTAMAAPGGLSVASKRYVQFRAEMTATNAGWQASAPLLKDVTIKWDGATRVVDIGADVTTGPDYGVFDLKVDDKSLAKGVTIDLTIFEDVRGWHGVSNRLTSTLTAEVEPRNTGK